MGEPARAPRQAVADAGAPGRQELAAQSAAAAWHPRARESPATLAGRLPMGTGVSADLVLAGLGLAQILAAGMTAQLVAARAG